jgi:hypothetical protein
VSARSRLTFTYHCQGRYHPAPPSEDSKTMEGLKWELDRNWYIEAGMQGFQDKQDEQDNTAATKEHLKDNTAEELSNDCSLSQSQDLLQYLIDALSGDDQVMESLPRLVIDLTADS